MGNLWRQALVLLTTFATLLSLTEARKKEWHSGYFTTHSGMFKPSWRDPWNLTEQKVGGPKLLPRAKVNSVLLLSKTGVGRWIFEVNEDGEGYVPIVQFGPDFKWRSLLMEDSPSRDALLTIGYISGSMEGQKPSRKDHFNAKVPTGDKDPPGFFDRIKRSNTGKGPGIRIHLDAVPLFLPHGYESRQQFFAAILNVLVEIKIQLTQDKEPSFLSAPFEKLRTIAANYGSIIDVVHQDSKQALCEALLADDVYVLLAFPGAEKNSLEFARLKEDDAEFNKVLHEIQAKHNANFLQHGPDLYRQFRNAFGWAEWIEIFVKANSHKRLTRSRMTDKLQQLRKVALRATDTCKSVKAYKRLDAEYLRNEALHQIPETSSS